MNQFGPRKIDDPLSRIVLVEPLIPENTGNISRTCVATGSELHLVKPMAFEITESRVQRAGLDYWPDLGWQMHESFAAWQAVHQLSESRIFYVETGSSLTVYDVEFKRGDWLVFGKETTGLGADILHDARPQASSSQLGNRPILVSIPMPGTTRSLNLSNAVAITVFELLRQTRHR